MNASDDKPENRMLRAALGYGKRGWRVLPVFSPLDDGSCSCRQLACDSSGKHPRIKEWQKHATAEEAKIREWWTRWPDSNIGVATGAGSGVVVLDVDPRHGGDAALASLFVDFGPLAETVQAETGGGGRHLVFQHPGVEIRNAAQIGGLNGLDFRGDGGFIVAAPSLHASGRRYRWVQAAGESSKPIAPLPGWLRDLLQRASAEPSRNGHVAHRAPVDEILLKGKRNVGLTSLAGSLRRRGLDHDTILARLRGENLQWCDPPLPETEVGQIAASVARYPVGGGGSEGAGHLSAPPPGAAGPLRVAEEPSESASSVEPPPAEAPIDAPIGGMVREALQDLTEAPTRDEVVGRLHLLAKRLSGVDATVLVAARYEAIDLLKSLKVAPEEARRLVGAALQRQESPGPQGDDNRQGQALTFSDSESWPEPVDGAALLDELASTLARFIVLPVQQAVAVALWIIFTYLLPVAGVAPRLAISSPLKRCGKSRLLAILAALVRRALASSSVSTAALFRMIEAYGPTVLIDEFDNAGLDNPEKADLRAVLNSGWSRAAAKVYRCVGDNPTPRGFSTWAAAAFALIGRLPDTLEDRSIVISLHRKTRGERVERLREGCLDAQLAPLRRRIARWAADHMQALTDADPAVPDALDDRAADNWRVLLAIADAAGGDWPERGRGAAVALSAGRAEADGAVGVMLLEDLREMFQDRGADRLSSEQVVEALREKKDRPWADWRHGKLITPRAVASLLKPFGITPTTVRLGADDTPKGYLREWFEEVFGRYLPPLNPPQRHNA